jgi:hypothetical protein
MLRAEMLRALNTACELRPLQVLTPHFPGRRQCGLHCDGWPAAHGPSSSCQPGPYSAAFRGKGGRRQQSTSRSAALYRCRHRRPSGARLTTLL